MTGLGSMPSRAFRSGLRFGVPLVLRGVLFGVPLGREPIGVLGDASETL